MKISSRAVSFALLATLASAAIADTPSADKVLGDAKAQAKKEHKNVLVIFHASWCGWCHKLDDMLADKTVGPLVTKQYVVVHLTVDESPNKKADENPGASAVRDSLGGGKAGLPFYAVINPKGDTLTSSVAPKSGNIGYPAAPEEIAYFMGMLDKSAPKMSAGDKTAVQTYLKTTAKTLGH